MESYIVSVIFQICDPRSGRQIGWRAQSTFITVNPVGHESIELLNQAIDQCITLMIEDAKSSWVQEKHSEPPLWWPVSHTLVPHSTQSKPQSYTN